MSWRTLTEATGAGRRPSNWKNNGKPFERQLEGILLQYAARNSLHMRKVDPPTKHLGGGKIVHLANPFLDYVGVWTAGHGQAVFFEAKSTGKPVLEFNKSGLTPGQLDSLTTWHGAGAVVFILWEYQQTVRLFPAVDVVEAKAQGKRSLAWGDGLAVAQGLGYVVYDFLEVIGRVWG